MIGGRKKENKEPNIPFNHVEMEITTNREIPITLIPSLEKTKTGVKISMNFHQNLSDEQMRQISTIIAEAISEAGGVANAKFDQCFNKIQKFTKAIPNRKRVVQMRFDLPEGQILPKVGVNEDDDFCYINQSPNLILQGGYFDTILGMLETFINSRDYLPKESELSNFESWLHRRIIQLVDSGEVKLRGRYQFLDKFEMMDLLGSELMKLNGIPSEPKIDIYGLGYK
ncbi:hypothetical protein [Leptospira levettii]|uniref:hypothetical protein n=1 Tax=Leptospira levettii TaxID=2023178 RepID=UPI000C2B34A4|nr:hypothetical protein [Leptospira levettii]PJZ87349.1 hypothetical protein CH368_17290 [Leptospira levettii]